MAASSFSPSAVLGMYRPDGIQRVAPFEAASAPGMAKKPTSSTLSGATPVAMAGMPNVIIG